MRITDVCIVLCYLYIDLHVRNSYYVVNLKLNNIGIVTSLQSQLLHHAASVRSRAVASTLQRLHLVRLRLAVHQVIFRRFLPLCLSLARSWYEYIHT